MDSASICHQIVAQFGESKFTLCAALYGLQIRKLGFTFLWGSTLKPTGLSFYMGALHEQIFCYVFCNVLISILLIRRKMKRRKEGKGRSCFTAAFSIKVSALQGLPPTYYNYR